MYAIYVERDGEMVVFDARSTADTAGTQVTELLEEGEKRVEVVEQ